jgi:hypothetical protein
LTYAQMDCDQGFDTNAPRSVVLPCQTDDRIRLVELLEVVDFNHRQTRQAVAGRHQFINLDGDVDTSTAHPEYGRLIRLQARVEWVSGDRSRPLSGQNVYWYARAAAGNQNGLTTSNSDSFDSVGGDIERKSTTTDASGWTPVVEYYLSTYGGDRFDVFATENASYRGGLQAGTYEVWKKFWYQITEMEDGEGGLYSVAPGVTTTFQATYRTVFIAFEEQAPRTRAAHIGNLSGSTERANAARPHFRVDAKCPFKAHIMTVDWSESGPVEEELNDTLTSRRHQFPDFIILWKHGPGSWPWKVSAQWRPTGDAQWTCRRISPVCPGHASATDRCPNPAGATWSCGADGCVLHSNPSHVCTGRTFHCQRTQPPCGGHSSQGDRCPAAAGAVWSCGATQCPGHQNSSDTCGNPRDWMDIPDAALSTVADPGRPGFKRITVDMSFAGRAVPSASNPVEVDLIVRKAPGDAFGWGGGSHHLYLCSGLLHDWDAPANWVTLQRGTAIHEIGHALGLVNLSPTIAHGHDSWEDAAHPSHCSMTPAQCSMYFRSSLTRVTRFHLAADGTGCHDHLRRQDFSRSVMAGKWRD